MDDVMFQRLCRKTIQFTQQFIDKVIPGLQVECLTEEQFEIIVRDPRSALNWRRYFPYYLAPYCFSVGFTLRGNSRVDGAFLARYQPDSGIVTLYLLESLVRNERMHPLQHRMTGLAMTMLTNLLFILPFSQAIYVTEPALALRKYYQRFGFNVDSDNTCIFASKTTLQCVQFKWISDFFRLH